ncbi:MAG: tetratricopeptide repeat protein [Bacteroidota bacterium]
MKKYTLIYPLILLFHLLEDRLKNGLNISGRRRVRGNIVKLIVVFSITTANTLFQIESSWAKSRSMVDSLADELELVKGDLDKAKILDALAWEYININPDTAYVIAQKQYEYAQIAASSVDDSIAGKGRVQMATALHNMGESHEARGNYPEALDHFFRGLKILEEVNNKQGILSCLNSIGIIFKNQGNYPEALNYYFQCLKVSEELNNKRIIGVSLNNIGIVYILQDNYKLALDYYIRSLNIEEEIGNKPGIARTLTNIGIVQRKLGNYDEALDYSLRSLKVKEELGNKSNIASSLITIGNIYSEQGDYPEALDYYLRALKIYEETDNKTNIAPSLGNIGTLKILQGDLTEGIDYCLKELRLAREMGHLQWGKSACQCLSDGYEKMGDYKLAYEYHKQYSEAKDSLFNEEKSKEIGKMEARYEMEKKIAEEKTKSEVEAKAVAEKVKRSNLLQYSGILIFIVLMFIGVFILGRFALPVRWAEGLVFFTFLLFFEFMLVLLDPYIERFSAGAPVIKLAFNAVLAGLIFPLHAFFEGLLKRRVLK